MERQAYQNTNAAMRSKSAFRVVAVASSGGHWQQLMLLRQAFQDERVLYLTTMKGLPEEYGASPAKIVPDCNRNEYGRIIVSMYRIILSFVKFRPHLIVSTGALPGALAIVIGRLFGAKTIWVDSVANAEELSMSGQLVRRFCHVFLTQSEFVSASTGVAFEGSVL